MLTTLNKPAGLPVFPPHEDPAGDCLLARLLHAEPRRRGVPWPAGFEGGIAHRLDVGTAGAVAVADDLDALSRLRDAFRARALRKTYRFMSARDVPWSHNRCEAPLAHAKGRRDRMVVQRGPQTPHRGRWLPAETEFLQLRGRLWQATMRTGVMHQIRAHAAFVGLPLAGDRHYGGGAAPPEGQPFCLVHVGFTDGGAITTAPIPLPAWASAP